MPSQVTSKKRKPDKSKITSSILGAQPSTSISQKPPTSFADVYKARILSPSARYSTTDNGAGVFTPLTRARFTPLTHASFTPHRRASFTETTKGRFNKSPRLYNASLDQRTFMGGQMSNNMQRKTKRRRNKNTNRIRNKYTNRRRNNSIRLH